MSNHQLAVTFLAQVCIILFFCKIVGKIAAKFGQPQVVAEMIAGVLLGPSLFGLFAPELSQKLFPAESLKVLFPISQLGLATYMFIVGLEFRMDIVRDKLKSSVAVSIAGMAAPFVFGALLAYVFYYKTDLFPDKTSLNEAMLFLGASMCVTAFPMLARIIHFKGLAGTTMGTVALGAGAIDDAAAWCLLALVLASFTGDFTHAAYSIGGGIFYVLFVMLVLKPVLHRLLKKDAEEQKLSDTNLVTILGCMAGCAWFTDLIGLHAVFGAFIMGSVVPRGFITETLIRKIQPLTVALLLPLFFTYSGLNTKIGLLNTSFLWFMALAVLFAAVVGKGAGCWLAAKATGLPNREALGIGTLMNARGLMELIIINIGLQRGIISEGIFAILVIMAVVTTLMASPIFDYLAGSFSEKAESLPEGDEEVEMSA